MYQQLRLTFSKKETVDQSRAVRDVLFMLVFQAGRPVGASESEKTPCPERAYPMDY